MTGDDFIEADGGVHNIRVMRNRGVNAAHTGLSAQPIFGGPAYYIRNIVYNTPVALKFSNPAGVIVYHNTIIAENRTAQRVSNAHFRNNLFLGTDAPIGISVLGGPTAYSTYDYDGFRPNAGAKAQYTWFGPKPGVMVDYDAPQNQGQDFATLADLAKATGAETHGIEVDYDIFESLPRPPRPRLVAARPAVRGDQPELQAEGGRQGRRRRRAAAERERWLLGQGAGPRRARSRRAACQSMGQDG